MGGYFWYTRFTIASQGIPLGMKLLRLLVFVLLLPSSAVQAMEASPLSIETADGRSLAFSVELARTPEELTRGLMDRAHLAADAGMLFDFGADRTIAMWMKNTLIPLDMIFIARDGRITGIAQRAVPLSLEIIPSPGPVRAVLEVNGGVAEHLGIKVGDRIVHPLFNP